MEFLKYKKIFFTSSLAVTAACVLSRLLSLIFFYDTDLGYYQANAVLPIIATYLPIVAVVAAAVLCALNYMKADVNAASNSRAQRFAALAVGAAFAIYAVMYSVSFAEYIFGGGELLPTFIGRLLFCLLSGAYFFYVALASKKSEALSTLLGLCVIVFSVMLLSASYFNNRVQMNAPNKIIFQFAYLSVMLLILNEMRTGMERQRVRFHIFSCAISSMLCAMSSIPSIIALFVGKMPTNYTLFFPDVILLTISIFAAIRLHSLCIPLIPKALEVEDKNEIDNEICDVASDTQE